MFVTKRVKKELNLPPRRLSSLTSHWSRLCLSSHNDRSPTTAPHVFVSRRPPLKHWELKIHVPEQSEVYGLHNGLHLHLKAFVYSSGVHLHVDATVYCGATSCPHI
jgi:hypothetical protein